MKHKQYSKRNARTMAAALLCVTIGLSCLAHQEPKGSNLFIVFAASACITFAGSLLSWFFARKLITHEKKKVYKRQHQLTHAFGKDDMMHKQLHS